MGNDLYISSDFGVLRRQGGTWVEAASGMPNVEVAGLTMVPGDHQSDRFLYAASHGLGAWKLEIDHH